MMEKLRKRNVCLNLRRLLMGMAMVCFFAGVFVETAKAETWQETLEQYFDIVDTFDELQDWKGTHPENQPDIQKYPDEFPVKEDGSPSIWQYYSYYGIDPVPSNWIQDHGPENVWRGAGKSAVIDYMQGGVENTFYGPERIGFKIGDSPDDGYPDEVHVFYMTKWFKEFFKTTGDSFDYHRFLKTLDISAGFKTVFHWGTDAEYDWVDAQGGRSQILNQYGMNAQVYNFYSYGSNPRKEIIKNTMLTTSPDNVNYEGTVYRYTSAEVGQPILTDSWFGIEYRVKTSDPHGVANGEFETWVYDASGNEIGHELVTGVINLKDGNTDFNHSWNKFVWGGNRFNTPGYGEPDEDFGPYDHFYMDDVAVHGSRIGPTYFSLLNGAAVTGDINEDEAVNIQDIQACVNHILGIRDWGNAADVNGGGVDVTDVQTIVNIILGQ